MGGRKQSSTRTFEGTGTAAYLLVVSCLYITETVVQEFRMDIIGQSLVLDARRISMHCADNGMIPLVRHKKLIPGLRLWVDD